MFVKCFTVNVNKCLKPIFIEQNINIVNTVTLQSLLLICRLIFTLCMQWRIQRGIMGFPRTFSPHHVYKYPIKMKQFGLSETKLFHFYGIFKKNEIRSEKTKTPNPHSHTYLYTFEPPFQKSWIRPWHAGFKDC